MEDSVMGKNGNIDVADLANKEAEERECPIMVLFDPETQAVRLKFDNELFKQWNFIISILDMAKREAEGQLRIAQLNAMQRQAVEQMQAQQLAAQLKGNILRG
jgi:hypothetical protein